jgi:hypothetical protein
VPDRYPIWNQLLSLALMPPCVVIAFYAMARGWVSMLQRGEARARAVAQVKTIALVMLLASYIVGFGEFVVVHYVLHR